MTLKKTIRKNARDMKARPRKSVLNASARRRRRRRGKRREIQNRQRKTAMTVIRKVFELAFTDL